MPTINDIVFDKIGEMGYKGAMNDRMKEFFENFQQGSGEVELEVEVVTMPEGTEAWCDVDETAPNHFKLMLYMPKADAGASGVAGPKGDPGERGEAGPVGLQGVQGIKGDKGDTGDVGPRGLQGVAGIQGIQGVKGDAGERGLQGVQGIEGPRGLTGLQGLPGVQGIQGVAGPNAVNLGTVAVTQTATVAINAGIRTVTVTGVTGLLTGDTVILTSTGALPVGYAIHNATATAAGTLQVTLSAPLLAIGATYTLYANVKVLR